jgi:two-component system NtrC family sensor kinase
MNAREHTAPQAPASTAGSRILVVDDNPHVAASFSDILSELGYLVDIAASGSAAVELIGSVKYAVIVADMQMPGLDGLALYWEVTARHPLLKDSFLFITGDVFRAETKRFLMETGAAYLGKPCTFEDVERAVQRVLLKRQANVTTGVPEKS